MKETRDPRATWRRRARRLLLQLVAEGERSYICATCGHIPRIPWDQPSRSGDILDVNHISKNLTDIDPANLEFLCRPCHLAKDRSTEKGVSPVGNFNTQMGYDIVEYDE